MSSERSAIGIDFGGTTVKIGIVHHAKLIDEAPPIATQEFESPELLIQAMLYWIDLLRAKYPNIQAIGVGMPGFVDFQNGVVRNLTNVPGWKNFPLKDRLEALTGLPCVVDNDANCMAYAEWKFGAAKGSHHAVCVTLGTGVGGGLIVNGQLLRGAHSAAGEIGQSSIHYDGRIGHYGNRGAVEDYIGNREIAADARQAYLAADCHHALEECSPAVLDQAARQGDPIAQKLWDDIAAKLACTLVNCCYLLNPEVIVVGGGVARAGRTLLDPLEKHLFAQISGPFADHLVVKAAAFGHEAGIIGAAALACELIPSDETCCSIAPH